MSEENNHHKLLMNAKLKTDKRIKGIYRKQMKGKLPKNLKNKDDKDRKFLNDAVKSTYRRLKLMKKHFIDCLTKEMEYIIANQPNAMESLRVKAIFMIGLQNKMIQKIRKSINQNLKIEKILTKDYDQAVIRRL
ncbi:unnamed protein product [Schistosoma rodhaini]|uniref:Uncharacterized protein n=1 Tax=Schistosoma rodhaini TaxID=6188 RepID=A0AA85EUA4_9TREM|nr:unnamed protein product [Schistosoma rodhaini]